MMMDFLRCKKNAKKTFVTFLRVAKLIINEQDIAVRTCKKVDYNPSKLYKTKEELEKAITNTIIKYNEIIFGPDSPVCMACLNELRSQQVINKKVYDQTLMDDTMRKLAWDELQKNIVMDGDMMIHGRTREVLDPEVDYTCWKDKF